MMASKEFGSDRDRSEKLVIGLVALFVLFWSSIGVGIAHYGWIPVWHSLFVSAMEPPFADMRSVQGSLLSMRSGFNPQVKNPGDPWGRVMNYPMVWSGIARLFRLDDETHFRLFVGIYVSVFLCSCAFLLRHSPSPFIFAAMVSGAPLLAVERGNNDLVIFVLILAACRLSHRYARALLLILATALKVFPAVAIFGLVRRARTLATISSLLACCMLWNLGELRLLRAGNTARGPLTYGLDWGIQAALEIWTNRPAHRTALFFVVKSVVIGALLLMALLVARKTSFPPEDHPDRVLQRDLFLAGGMIFCWTFVLGNNWDYRLVFVLLCMPYILAVEPPVVKYLALTSILLSFNVLTLRLFGATGVSCALAGKYCLFALILSFLLKEMKRYPVMRGLTVATMGWARARSTPRRGSCRRASPQQSIPFLVRMPRR